MRNETAAKIYGFTAGDSFAAFFGKLSVESVLFYLFAVAAWTLENMFEAFRSEVNASIDKMKPHRPKWYRDMVLAYMKDRTLIPDTDEYDTADMTDEEITAARVVKHAVADESDDASLLTIKVAGGTGRPPLSARRADRKPAQSLHRRDQGRRGADGAGEHRARPL